MAAAREKNSTKLWNHYSVLRQMMRRMMMLTVSTMLMINPSSSSLSPPGPTNDAVVVVVFRCKVVRTYITVKHDDERSKSTIFRPFEAH